MLLGEIKIPVEVNIDVVTSIEGKVILHDAFVSSEELGYSDINRLTLDTIEEQSRLALINLGWKPPEEKEE